MTNVTHRAAPHASGAPSTDRAHAIAALNRRVSRARALIKVLALYAGAAALALGLHLPSAHANLAAAPANDVRVERIGDEIVVQATAEVDADRTLAWSTLSDYDRLSEFIPGMASSRTVSRDGDEAVVEQKGSAGFGPFRQKFTVVLGVRETKYESIAATGRGGDFMRFDARYELVPLDGGRTRIVYRATLVPAMPVPPLVGLPVLRSMIRGQFDALIDEVRRRAG
jgi:carbon monoxide dehydrogenase subunit G